MRTNPIIRGVNSINECFVSMLRYFKVNFLSKSNSKIIITYYIGPSKVASIEAYYIVFYDCQMFSGVI